MQDELHGIVEALNRIDGHLENIVKVLKVPLETPTGRRNRLSEAFLSALLVNTGGTNLSHEAMAKAIEMMLEQDKMTELLSEEDR